MTTTQIRIYKMKDGRLPDWEELFRSRIRALRQREGFRVVGAWSDPIGQRFVWILERDGSQEDFEAADRAYYELPDHAPMHQAALEYLASGESSFVTPQHSA
jgi:hypothetical protein